MAWYLSTDGDDLVVYKGRGKGKVHPRTDHEGPVGEKMYSSTLPSTFALDGGGWSMPRPGRLYPRERTGTHCTGAWGSVVVKALRY